jgi:pimeloyl-ACP methyl ester carboxylesterase
VSFALALALCGLRGLDAPAPPFHDAFGRGSTVVLLHGLGSSAGHWLPTARRLARRHRVVLVDLPGHGESAMPAPFSLDRAVEALDQALASESRVPVVLVAHSIGGLVATAEALEHPRRIRGLVLVETALRPQFEGAERDAMLSALDHDYQALLRSAYAAFGRDSAQGAALYAEVAALDSTSIKPWIRLALTADLSERVARLEPPVLVVLAARSWPVGEPWRQTARELGYTRLPRIQAARLDRCGHFIMLDRPAELAEAIERFIAHPDGEPVAARRAAVP